MQDGVLDGGDIGSILMGKMCQLRSVDHRHRITTVNANDNFAPEFEFALAA